MLTTATELLQKSLTHFHEELAGLQIGRASASLVESLPVEIFEVSQPLKNLASISVPDAKTLFIEPWDKANLPTIEKAINDSALGLNPNNDGQRIILNIPPLTEERRHDLTKLVGQAAENARIAVRRVREDFRNKAKHQKEADELAENELKMFESQLQTKVDEVNQQINEAAKQKEQDMMVV